MEGGRPAHLHPKMVIDRIPPGKAARERFFKQLRVASPASLKAVWTGPEAGFSFLIALAGPVTPSGLTICPE